MRLSVRRRNVVRERVFVYIGAVSSVRDYPENNREKCDLGEFLTSRM